MKDLSKSNGLYDYVGKIFLAKYKLVYWHDSFIFLAIVVYKLKAVTCSFVPPLRGLFLKNRVEKDTVTPTYDKKFFTQNPAVFL